MTIAETGLHPDTLSQLMLKTLIAGESSGTQLAESLRLPYSVLDAMIQHARVEKLIEVRGAGGAGTAGYRYALTDLGRDRARCSSSTSAATSVRPRCRWPTTTRTCAPCMAARTWVDRDILAKGFDQLDRQPGDVRPARAGRQLGQVALPLRRARQRQDGRRRGDRPRARHQHVRAARHRRRRPDHHHVRSGHATCRRRRPAPRRASSPARRTIAGGRRSGGRSWSSAAS